MPADQAGAPSNSAPSGPPSFALNSTGKSSGSPPAYVGYSRSNPTSACRLFPDSTPISRPLVVGYWDSPPKYVSYVTCSTPYGCTYGVDGAQNVLEGVA